MEIALDKNLRITGYVISSCVGQPEKLFTRSEPIYSLELMPEDRFVSKQLAELIYLKAGHSKQGRETAEQLETEPSIKFESILEPMTTGLLFKGDEYRPQQRVTVRCRFELNGIDGLEANGNYLRCVLQGVDLAPESDTYGETAATAAAEAKYGELVF